MDLKNVKAITIPQGSVKKITDSNGNVIWGNSSDFPYRRLEYVICNGAAAINTGIQADVKSGTLNTFQLKFMPTAVGTQQRILANYTPNVTNTRKYAVVLNGNTSIQNVIAGNWGGTTLASNNTDYVVWSSMLYNGRYISVNDGAKETLTSATSENPTANQMYALGAGYNYNTSGYYENGFIGRIYGLKAWRNTLSSSGWDFIPVQRKSDNKVGFLRIKYTYTTGVVGAVDFLPSDWTTDFQAGSVADEYFNIKENDQRYVFDWE